MSKFLIVNLFILSNLICHSQSNIIDIVPIDRHIDTVAILTGIKMESGNYKYKMRIINPTNQTIEYLNFSRTQPWYKIKKQNSDSTFSIQNAYFCLTEAKQIKLKPGKCAYFYIYEDPSEVQIGIEYTIYPNKEKHITWSKLIKSKN